MKGSPKPSPSWEVPNVTPGQPGGSIGESGESHGLAVIFRNIEISRTVDRLFMFDRTQLNSIGATAPMCLKPADFRPLGEWMSRNLVIPHLANVLNATSLVLPFPDCATYQQTQSIESELLEIKDICLNHYNASVLISPNQTSQKRACQVVFRDLQWSLLVHGPILLRIMFPLWLDELNLRKMS